jgi:uncharacterized protein with von Willebrand factor type A (vWA) domain
MTSSGLLDRHIAFLEALRSAGLPVSLAENLDAIAALQSLHWGARSTVHDAYAATLVKRQSQRPTFDALFDLYFPGLVGSGAAADDSGDETVRDGAEALRGFREELLDALADGDDAELQRLAVEAVGRFGAMPGPELLVGLHRLAEDRARGPGRAGGGLAARTGAHRGGGPPGRRSQDRLLHAGGRG